MEKSRLISQEALEDYKKTKRNLNEALLKMIIAINILSDTEDFSSDGKTNKELTLDLLKETLKKISGENK